MSPKQIMVMSSGPGQKTAAHYQRSPFGPGQGFAYSNHVIVALI